MGPDVSDHHPEVPRAQMQFLVGVVYWKEVSVCGFEEQKDLHAFSYTCAVMILRSICFTLRFLPILNQNTRQIAFKNKYFSHIQALEPGNGVKAMGKHNLMSAHSVMVLCPMEQVAPQVCLAPHSARAATSAHHDAIPTGATLPKHLT